jgi:hypothetical protein
LLEKCQKISQRIHEIREEVRELVWFFKILYYL